MKSKSQGSLDRICRHCGLTSAETYFNKTGIQCKVCRNGIARYGLNRLQQEELLKSQNELCWLCDNEIELFTEDKSKIADIDHNHLTGEVRGVLCKPCNKSTLLDNLQNKEIEFNKFKEYLKL